MHILVKYQGTSSVVSKPAFCSHRCLLIRASMSMTHHYTDTHQYGTFWKGIPLLQQLSVWEDTQKEILTAGCGFGGWLVTKLLKKQVVKTSSSDWWEKMGQTNSDTDSASCTAHPSPLQHRVHMGAAKLWPPQLQLLFGGQSNSISQ